MKTVFKSISAVLLALAINGIITGCGSSLTSDPAPVAACKLKKSVYTASGTLSTATYTYEGELLKTQVDVYEYTGSPTVTNTTTYVYNAEGYAMSSTSGSSAGGTPITSTYNYTSGRLTSTGVNVTFEYDTNGNLTRIVGPGGTTTYQGGILTGITSSNPYPVNVVQNGRIIKTESSATFRSEYSYDSDGRIAEVRLYSNNNLSNRQVYEYESAIPPVIKTKPALKGWPVLPHHFGTVAYAKKVTGYNGAGVLILTANYVNSFNSRSYPTSTVINSTNSGTNGSGTYTQGTTFEYQDCQ